MMECPNCRKVEEGNWHCTSGSSSPEPNENDVANDDEADTDYSYSEMEMEIRLCPYSRLERFLALIDQREPAPVNGNQDFLALLAIFVNHPHTLYAADPHASYARVPPPVHTVENLERLGEFFRQWSNQSHPTDAQTYQASPSIGPYYPYNLVDRHLPVPDSSFHASNLVRGAGTLMAPPYTSNGYVPSSQHQAYRDIHRQNRLNFIETPRYVSTPLQGGGSSSEGSSVHGWDRFHLPPSQHVPVYGIGGRVNYHRDFTARPDSERPPTQGESDESSPQNHRMHNFF